MNSRTRSKRINAAASFADIGLFSLHWLAETVGATHPIRFGLALALSLVFNGLGKAFASPPISEFTYQFFGLAFFIFFLPLVFAHRRIPEAWQEYLALLDIITKRSGVTRIEKKLIYIELMEALAEKGPVVLSVKFDEVKSKHALALSKRRIAANMGTHQP